MVAIIFAVVSVIVALSPGIALAQAFEGFGATTPGGTGKPIARVTNLNSSGAGSLAAALSGSNRYIVFDVGGTINGAMLVVNGLSFITIDGTTAPPPGITISGGQLVFEDGSHDIIVRNVRSRNSADDCMRVFNSHDIVFDHVSAGPCGDGALDITEGSYNVTVQFSMFYNDSTDGSPGTMLIKYGGTRNVSVHHNLFTGRERHPLVSFSGDDPGCCVGTTLMLDFRNNIVWNWGRSNGTQFGFGSRVDHGAWANLVNNFYQAAGSYPNLKNLAIQLNANGVGGRLFTSGNVSGNGVNLNSYGNVGSVIGSPVSITQHTACAAAALVRAGAGAQPRDSRDQTIIAGVSLAGCPGALAGPSAPTAVQLR
jgi:hypothetical protein